MTAIDFTSFSNIIDGKLTNTASTRTGVNPATGEPLFPCPVSTPDDVDAAIKAARIAFKSWKKTSVEHRKQQLVAFSAALIQHKAEFVKLLTTEQGKPVSILRVWREFSDI
jgi:acyl-CoA reductase-like NAD-dependent aldehyde dehydrogenase